MITYNDIYESARKEKSYEQLQFLPKNFVTEVSKYFQEKKQLLAEEKDGFSETFLKTKKQLENAMTFFKEVIVRRRKKILNLVLIAAETGISKQDFENMFNFEKELFEDLIQCLKISDGKLGEILKGDEILGVQLNEMIIFKEDVLNFAGLDAEAMGPFEKGQIANLPKEITKILIESEKAERVYE